MIFDIKQFVETNDSRRSVELVNNVLQARDKFGRIIGNPGTGKTQITHYLAHKFGAIRVCAWFGMTRKTLISIIGKQVGLPANMGKDEIIMRLIQYLQGNEMIIIIDECNHLDWQHLEQLRFLPDECDATLILAGTHVFERKFSTGKDAEYLEQLNGRTGTHKIELNYMSAKEMAAYAIQPRMNAKVSQSLAKEFFKVTKGSWRFTADLLDACERVMGMGDFETLGIDVLHAAAASLEPGE